MQIAEVSMAFVETSKGGKPVLAVQYKDGKFASAARPMVPGDTVAVYLTGLGATKPTFPDGTAPNTTAAALHQPKITVKGVPAKVLYAGVQPQYPGLDEIVFVVPKFSLPSGQTTTIVQFTVPSVSRTVSYPVPAS